MPSRVAAAGRTSRRCRATSLLEVIGRRATARSFPARALGHRPRAPQTLDLHPHGARHHRAQGGRGADPRHHATHDAADRSAQSRAVRRPPRHGAQARAPAASEMLAVLFLDLDRFKIDQRHARPLDRRRAAGRAEPTAARARSASRGHRRAHGRRRVHLHPARAADRRGRDQAGAEDPRGDPPAVPHRRPRAATSPPASGSACIRSTGTSRTSCSNAPTWRCTGPRSAAATGSSCTTRPSTSGCPSRWCWRSTCGMRSSTISSSCSISPRSPSTAAG